MGESDTKVCPVPQSTKRRYIVHLPSNDVRPVLPGTYRFFAASLRPFTPIFTLYLQPPLPHLLRVNDRVRDPRGTQPPPLFIGDDDLVGAQGLT